jgi:hypothetical protein
MIEAGLLKFGQILRRSRPMPTTPEDPEYDLKLTGWRYCTVCNRPVAVIVNGERRALTTFGGVHADGGYRCKKHKK